jgi:predicted dehydrogenase
MDRRRFLQTSAGALTAASFTRIAGAAERIRLGVIGSGARGQLLTGVFKGAGVDVVAACDVYEPNLEKCLKLASPDAKGYKDYRRLLEDKSLDAVIVASPDHWHARMAIDAVDAGKDVYLEKPMAHTIEEGFRIVSAVRRARRIVQIGSQRRSSDFFIEGKAIMDSGQLGNVRLVTSHWLNYTDKLSSAKLQGELDWNAWLGSAPKRPLDPLRFFNWYRFSDYAGGMLTSQAAHIFDAIQWFMNSHGPSAVTCVGGRINLQGADVPDTATLTVEFPENYLATFTISYEAMHYATFNDQLKQFHGSRARFDIAREWRAVYPQSDALDMKPSQEKRDRGAFGRSTRLHVENFLDCVRTRKDPNAPVEAGNATNILLCMAIQSMRSGRRLVWNAAKRKVEG